MKLNTSLKALAIGTALLGAGAANAALSTSYTFNGNGNWSLDGCGSNNSNPVCTIDAVVPSGSTIQAAFLYSTLYTTSVVPTVTFSGQTYSGAQWTNLGANGYLNAYRTDVTAQVAAAVGGGSAVPFSFTVNNESPNSSIDGEVLAIVYSNPSETFRTVAFLDGFSASSGDHTAVNLSNAITAANLADPNFDATLSLGIGFGYQPSTQYSRVTVNGSTMTTCAGGQDDGGGFNGGLVTVGGLGDDASNNHTCNGSGPRQDDELYDLVPFLSAGDTSISIDTLNPSSDDNIFFAGINITALARVNEPAPPSTPPSTVAEPATSALLGLGLFGLSLIRRNRKA